MKQLFLCVTIMTLLSSTFPNGIQANVTDLSGPSDLPECVVYTPDLPGFPQDNDFLCADVNEDGMVNVLDIISLVNYIMGGSPSPFNQDAADVNADDFINVLDIISMVNIIMQVQGLPCGCVAPVTYEGKTYPTVQIGDQCWFKENLNVGTMIAVNTGGQLQTDNGIMEKYCYNNDPGNCNAYGGLYEWHEAMQYVTDEGAMGICPAGWHIATDGEWKVLEGTVDSQYPVGDTEWDRTGDRGFDAGKNMKTTSGWQDGGNGTNLSGFTGLPAGHRYENGFYEMGAMGLWWTSSEAQYNLSWQRYIPYYFDGVFRTEYPGGYNGFSVRCLKGCWPEPTQSNAGPDQLNVPGTSTTLAGNTPEYGTGLWAIETGTGGTIVTPTSPTSGFQGVAGNEYTLSWTITTPCGSSIDEVVISFAEDGSFTCGNDLEYEGQSYATVQIGYQCWMAENLNIGSMIISTSSGQLQMNNGSIEKYCYGNIATNCNTYGGLYEWNEAMQYSTTEGVQGICPEGWHFPTDGEWTILSTFLGGTAVAGGKMKSTGTLGGGTGLWFPPNTGATNESGFTGHPGGYRDFSDGSFKTLSTKGAFWSSSLHLTIPVYAWGWGLGYTLTSLSRNYDTRENGRSVRCLRDCDILPSQADAGPDQTLYETSTTLAGNTPASGTGQWLILNGTGGTITDPASPTSGFQGLTCTTYTLSWTISTECGSSSDTVLISFAPTVSFTCGDALEDCRDGQSYATVQIGDQCWMAENLNVGTKINNTSGGFLQTDNNTIEKYCYENEVTNCDTYGGLYEWNEAMQYVTAEGARGICPYGWHIPTDGQWTALTTYLGGTSVAGGKMKSTGNLGDGTGLWFAPNTGATNESGFTGLPGGIRYVTGGLFLTLGTDAFFWSSSRYVTNFAWYRTLSYNDAAVHRDYTTKDNGYSIRCLKDL